MELADILDDSLQQLNSDQAVADCLAQHPDQAAELAPMLHASLRLQDLAAQRLSEGQRLRAKFAMREALAARAARPAPWAWFRGTPALRALSAAGAVVLLLFVMTTAVIAASGPGDPAYPLRVRLERVPALIQTTAAARVRTELAVADRRMADLEAYLAASDDVDATALDALMAGQTAVAANRGALSAEERAQIAARLETQAQLLTQLAARGPEPQAANRLQVAAQHALAVAQRLRAGPQPPIDPPPSPTGAEPSAGPHTTPAQPKPGTATPARPEPPAPGGAEHRQTPQRTAPAAGERPGAPSVTPGGSRPGGANPATAPDVESTPMPATAAPEATPTGPGSAPPHGPGGNHTPESGATPSTPGNGPAPATSRPRP